MSSVWPRPIVGGTDTDASFTDRHNESVYSHVHECMDKKVTDSMHRSFHLIVAYAYAWCASTTQQQNSWMNAVRWTMSQWGSNFGRCSCCAPPDPNHYYYYSIQITNGEQILWYWCSSPSSADMMALSILFVCKCVDQHAEPRSVRVKSGSGSCKWQVLLLQLHHIIDNKCNY